MRQIVQLEGSNVCGPVTAAMILDHFGVPWDLDRLILRAAEMMGTSAELPRGTNDPVLASLLTEGGLLAFESSLGHPMSKQDDGRYFTRAHAPRENRLATWYVVHQMLKTGWIAAAGIERDAGKLHWVAVDDAFIRAQERWFSVVCPIRGAYEEHAERFMLDPNGKGDAEDWVFARKRPARFASAAEIAKLGDRIAGSEEDAPQTE